MIVFASGFLSPLIPSLTPVVFLVFPSLPNKCRVSSRAAPGDHFVPVREVPRFASEKRSPQSPPTGGIVMRGRSAPFASGIKISLRLEPAEMERHILPLRLMLPYFPHGDEAALTSPLARNQSATRFQTPHS